MTPSAVGPVLFRSESANGCRPRGVVFAALLATGAVAGLAAPVSPVIDDEQLARGFVVQLGRLVDAAGPEASGAPAATLTADVAAEQLIAAEGRQVDARPAATPCLLPTGRPVSESVMQAVVVMGSIYKCDQCDDWHLGGLASGWLLTADGLVVTNHHVLKRASNHRLGVMTADGEVHAVRRVLASDAAGDAAVVEIDTRRRRLPWLPLGQAVHVGDDVGAISHPAGRFYCLTEGVVSRFHRQARRGDTTSGPPQKAGEPPNADPRGAVWMSVTADFAVGSSGGPVFNTAGEVVGMVARTSSSRSGTPHFAMPDNAGDQMVFRDCVSLDTLRRLIGVTAGQTAP